MGEVLFVDSSELEIMTKRKILVEKVNEKGKFTSESKYIYWIVVMLFFLHSTIYGQDHKLHIENSKFIMNGTVCVPGIYMEDFKKMIENHFSVYYDGKILKRSDIDDYLKCSITFSENGTVNRLLYSYPFYSCTIDFFLFDDTMKFVAYDPMIISTNALGSVSSKGFEKIMKSDNPKKEQHKKYIADFEKGLNCYLEDLLKLNEKNKIPNRDNGRSVDSEIKILYRSGKICSSVGWSYDKLADEWISTDNNVDNRPNRSLNEIQFFKIEYKKQVFYVLSLLETVGSYKYPTLEIDWELRKEREFYIYTQEEYNKLKNMDCDTIFCLTDMGGFTFDVSIRGMLSGVKKCINSDNSNGITNTLYINVVNNNIVHFNIFSGTKIEPTTCYYEISFDEFEKLIIND